jgi:hypothetical protein
MEQVQPLPAAFSAEMPKDDLDKDGEHIICPSDHISPPRENTTDFNNPTAVPSSNIGNGSNQSVSYLLKHREPASVSVVVITKKVSKSDLYRQITAMSMSQCPTFMARLVNIRYDSIKMELGV